MSEWTGDILAMSDTVRVQTDPQLLRHIETLVNQPSLPAKHSDIWLHFALALTRPPPSWISPTVIDAQQYAAGVALVADALLAEAMARFPEAVRVWDAPRPVDVRADP
jgi:hypothetical protein